MFVVISVSAYVCVLLRVCVYFAWLFLLGAMLVNCFFVCALRCVSPNVVCWSMHIAMMMRRVVPVRRVMPCGMCERLGS